MNPHRSKDRKPLDLYPTPQPLADAIAAALAPRTKNVRLVVEPSCGPGPFIRAARKAWPDAKVIGCDLDPKHRVAAYAAGVDVFLERDYLATGLGVGPDVVIGNPPYSLAERFVAHSYEHLRPGGIVAFLLRLSFLGSARRVDLWHVTDMPDVYPIVPRPSFTGDGKTESIEYGLFVWTKGRAAAGRVYWPVTWTREPRVKVPRAR